MPDVLNFVTLANVESAQSSRENMHALVQNTRRFLYSSEHITCVHKV